MDRVRRRAASATPSGKVHPLATCLAPSEENSGSIKDLIRQPAADELKVGPRAQSTNGIRAYPTDNDRFLSSRERTLYVNVPNLGSTRCGHDLQRPGFRFVPWPISEPTADPPLRSWGLVFFSPPGTNFLAPMPGRLFHRSFAG